MSDKMCDFSVLIDIAKDTKEWKEMQATVEDSPWHREANVAVHTEMVLNEYEKIISKTGLVVNDKPISFTNMHKSDMLGALACLFHDFGKPAAKRIPENRITKDDGTVYYRFAGHEMMSARLWEAFAVRHNMLILHHYNLTPKDIYRVSWLIENHLPYGLKHPDKVQALVAMITNGLGNSASFFNMLLADCYGRISDDHEAKKQKVHDYVEEMSVLVNNYFRPHVYNDPNKPKMVLLCGPSGSGKSTYKKKHFGDFTNYSWDDLRLEYYFNGTGKKHSSESEQYAEAFEYCKKHDNEWNRYQQSALMDILKAGKNVVIDNMNLSKKSRKNFIIEGKKRGYEVSAVVFLSDPDILVKRQKTRGDKEIGGNIVRSMHGAFSMPSEFGEVDKVDVVSSMFDEDDYIDTSDIPEITDEQFAKAVRGKFFKK